ncbi:hypothetical protein ABBQ32_007342 [Trebouxia sp. C0010 RCD-2024]
MTKLKLPMADADEGKATELSGRIVKELGKSAADSEVKKVLIPHTDKEILLEWTRMALQDHLSMATTRLSEELSQAIKQRGLMGGGGILGFACEHAYPRALSEDEDSEDDELKDE